MSKAVAKPAAERFWELVNGPWCDPHLDGSSCWRWMGGVGFSRRKWVPREGALGRQRARYGRFRWSSLQLIGAHQAALLLTVGPPSGRAVAAHSCGNTLCVNPLHLRWDTQSANVVDAWVTRRLLAEVAA